MEIKFSPNNIKISKELGPLDIFVLDFCRHLGSIKYAIVSGYVAILFGRNRSSEDIDIFIDRLNYAQFQNLWKRLKGEFDCIITDDAKIAFNDYLQKGTAIRFARKGEFIPNMEIKFTKNGLDEWAISKRVSVILNDNKLCISPIELQISFKLFLGSEKDIEDARYLYKIFNNNINIDALLEFNRKLKIEEIFNKYIK